MSGRRDGRSVIVPRAAAPGDASSGWKFAAPLAIGIGFVIGLAWAKARRSSPKRGDGRWHSMSAPSDYESDNADEIRLILREARISREVIETIARGSWAGGDLPPIGAAEDYHAYAAAVAGLEQLSATATGVVAGHRGADRSRAAGSHARWETGQRVA